MTKRKIALLGAILALSATSMANILPEVTPLSETKGDMTVRGRATNRLNMDRTEIEFNDIWLTDKTRLDIEWTRDSYDTDGVDGSDVQFELFTQLGDSGRWELYTDFRPYDSDDRDGPQGYVDVMPTFVIARTENFSSIIRGGVGYDHKQKDPNHKQLRIVSEYKNYWTVNEWLELEWNAYYTHYQETDLDVLDLEAYWYTNYELMKFDNGVTITFLTEGGMDPYTFAEREFAKNSTKYDHDSTEDDYVFYFQPTVKINVPLEDGKYNVYMEPGYYYEAKGGSYNTPNTDKDGLFMRVGFSTKF